MHCDDINIVLEGMHKSLKLSSLCADFVSHDWLHANDLGVGVELKSTGSIFTEKSFVSNRLSCESIHSLDKKTLANPTSPSGHVLSIAFLIG